VVCGDVADRRRGPLAEGGHARALGEAFLAVLGLIWADATRLGLLVTLSYELQRSSDVGPSPSLSEEYIHLHGGTLPTGLP
jgi:hypothetical protein